MQYMHMKKIIIVALAWLSVTAARADEGMWLLSKLKQQNIEKNAADGFQTHG